MTSDRCEMIKAFAVDPRARAGQIRGELGEILSHLDVCEVCEATLDKAADTEAIFEVLADEESLVPKDERWALDRWTTPDTKRKDEVHYAVMELQNTLRRKASDIGARFDPSTLHATTEAVSLAIRRSIGQNPVPVPWVELHRHGTVTVDGHEAISALGLAAEIAVFTNHWAESEMSSKAPEPSSQAHLLALWSFWGVHDQRHLFRHFRAMPPVFGLPFMSEEHVVLVPLRREERIDNLYERWRPDSVQHLKTLYIVRPAAGVERAYEVVALAMAHVEHWLRDAVAVMTLMDLGLGSGTDAFIGAPTPLGLPETKIDSPLEPRVFGPFGAVTFRGRNVELQIAPEHLVTLAAERIAWRWDALGLGRVIYSRDVRS